MKRKMAFPVFLAVVMMLCLNLQIVFAADTASLYLKAKNAGGKEVKVTCEAENLKGFTNGKVRIRYDAEQMTLVKSEPGLALTGFSCEINDCVQGTKAEGEIVVVFASATAKVAAGSLVDLTFEKAEGVKLEDLWLSLTAEELQNDGTPVDVKVAQTQYSGWTELVKLDKIERETETVPDGDKKAISNTEVLEIEDCVFNKKSQRPEVTVKDGDKVLTEGTDYVLSYANNKKVGLATVTVIGIGAYEGKKDVNFKIVPPTPTWKKVVSAKKRVIYAKWTKVKQSGGYEIQVSKKKSFKKVVKTVTINKRKKSSKRFKVTKKGKYFVRIRSFKVIDGVKYYSPYSKVKRLKVKA